MFSDVFSEFFSRITAGFGCRLCDRKRALSINKKIMYSGVSCPLECEVAVKVCALNAQVCMCMCVEIWSDIPMRCGYEIMRLHVQLLTLTVYHQSKCITVTAVLVGQTILDFVNGCLLIRNFISIS